MEITDEEREERYQLLELQKDRMRWFSQHEFERLKELSMKMFKADNNCIQTGMPCGVPCFDKCPLHDSPQKKGDR